MKNEVIHDNSNHTDNFSMDLYTFGGC